MSQGGCGFRDPMGMAAWNPTFRKECETWGTRQRCLQKVPTGVKNKINVKSSGQGCPLHTLCAPLRRRYTIVRCFRSRSESCEKLRTE
jgi:hypothetical protein